MSSTTHGVLDSFYEDLTTLQCKVRSLLTRSEISCNILIESYEKLRSSHTLDEAVSSFKNYQKVVLDLTFCKENILVDEEFRSHDAVADVNELISILTSIETLCQYFGSRKSDVLSKEMTKCLLWRKGALLYMYCATIYDDSLRKSVVQESYFPKFLVDGVTYLKLMLEVFGPSCLPEGDIACNNEVIITLLTNGVRDSTDMLAFMYAGEMCYWYTTISRSEMAVELDVFPAKQMAVEFLQKYVQLSKEPCFQQSWSCDRANSLLNELLTNDST